MKTSHAVLIGASIIASAIVVTSKSGTSIAQATGADQFAISAMSGPKQVGNAYVVNTTTGEVKVCIGSNTGAVCKPVEE